MCMQMEWQPMIEKQKYLTREFLYNVHMGSKDSLLVNPLLLICFSEESYIHWSVGLDFATSFNWHN